jgi:MIP family channel proteins
MRLIRPLTAEFLGTYALVFAGTAAAVSDNFPSAKFGILGIALAHGLILGAWITAVGSISGAHFNPAVTLGFLSIRKIELKTALAYIGAQLVGGLAGAYSSRFLIPNNVGRVVSNGVPQISISSNFNQAVALEAVMTFFLMSAIIGTVVNPKAPKLGGLWVGLTLIVMILLGGPVTGAALNPARAFGPAVVSGVWTAQLAYWIGPILGAVVAAFVWDKVLLKEEA